MSAINIGGLKVPAFDELKYTVQSLGPRERSQCGYLWGYDLGKIIEGTAEIGCLSHEQGCDFISWLCGEGESWLFDNTTVGTRGNDIDPSCSTPGPFVPTPGAPPFGGADWNFLQMALGRTVCFPVGISIAPGSFTGWTADLWTWDGAAWTHWVVRGFGPFTNMIIQDGVNIGPVSPIFSVHVPSGGFLINGNNSPAQLNFRHDQISEQTALSVFPQMNFQSAVSAGLPYVTVSGELFKNPFKAKIEIGEVTRRKYIDQVTGTVYSNSFWFTIQFRQALPSFAR